MVYNCANSFVYHHFQTSKSNANQPKNALAIAIDDCMRELQVVLLRPLSKRDQQDVIEAFNIMDPMTNGTKLPRLFQIQTALEILNRKHTMVHAGTGAGKTIAMLLLMLLCSEWVFITIAPLLVLQQQHVETFTKFGVSTVALNQDTPPEERPRLMKAIQNKKIQHIVVSPEQCSRSGSEPPMLTRLLEEPTFTLRVRCLIFDEAHFIVTSEQPDKEGNVFQVEYLKGYEVRICLPIGVPCALFSATMSQEITDKILASLWIPRSEASFILLSTNRKNLSYSVRRLEKPLKNLSNLDFLFFSQIHPPLLPPKKTLIFVPTTDSALCMETYVQERLTDKMAARVHASLSSRYKKRVIKDFCNPSGELQVLISTSLISNGFDPPNVELVVLYGAPTNMLDFEQIGGRGGQDGTTNCLVMLMAEPWLFEEMGNGSSSKQRRTDNDVFYFAQTTECLRVFLAELNDDQTETAHNFTGPSCCSSTSHMDDFNFDYWICGPSASLETINSNSGFDNGSDSDSDSGSGSGSDSDPDTALPIVNARQAYRPKAERKKLETLLSDWRLKVHNEDPMTMFFPLDNTLSSKSITQLACFKAGDLETTSVDSIVEFLGETGDWKEAYAAEVYNIISNFNLMSISLSAMKNSKNIKKPKRVQPQDKFMSVLDLGLLPTEPTAEPATKKRKNSQANSVASSSRTPLGEVSLNKQD